MLIHHVYIGRDCFVVSYILPQPLDLLFCIYDGLSCFEGGWPVILLFCSALFYQSAASLPSMLREGSNFHTTFRSLHREDKAVKFLCAYITDFESLKNVLLEQSLLCTMLTALFLALLVWPLIC